MIYLKFKKKEKSKNTKGQLTTVSYKEVVLCGHQHQIKGIILGKILKI